MDRHDAYETLVRRCAGWDLGDLGDLLHEIDHDPDLDGARRAALRARLYERIWERARPLLGRDEPAAVLARCDRAVTESKGDLSLAGAPASEIADPDERGRA